ncbi:hypothetical protein N8314_03965 [Akkermansiaceae bacterium]|nr:hypothetical protein [Akkermansiaceae bacterium]
MKGKRIDYDETDEILATKDYLKKIRGIKQLMSVRINKAQSALADDRLADLDLQLERQRELNTRISYELTRLESHLRGLKVLNK